MQIKQVADAKQVCLVYRVLVSSPDPTQEESVWWHPADLSGFINIDDFLERKFSLPITLQETQSVVATPETLGYFSAMTQHFFWQVN